MPTRDQIVALYGAMAAADRDKALAAADAINPKLKADLQRDPQGVMDVAASLLQDADYPAVDVVRDAFTQSAGAVEKPAFDPMNLIPSPLTATQLAGTIVGEKIAGRLAKPALAKLAGTRPVARLLGERAAGGVGAALGWAAPEVIRSGSAEGLTSPETAVMAALPVGGALLRRAIPGAGGAIRGAEATAGELGKFRQALRTPGRGALKAGGETFNLGAVGIERPALPRGLSAAERAQKLQQLVSQTEQAVGMGQRPGVLTPSALAQPGGIPGVTQATLAQETGAAAQDAVEGLLNEARGIGIGRMQAPVAPPMGTPVPPTMGQPVPPMAPPAAPAQVGTAAERLRAKLAARRQSVP